ncbi:MAG: radical SAM family heme chaperone HemW [Clostridia bacterium]|nr:radical SAM family heme chaperone HemW [Clostridia bacterium]
MKFLTKLGLYLHIPFCVKKCAYCDFYSAVFTEEMAVKYFEALKREIKQWGGKINRPIDTIYLGGGTPSLLNDKLPNLLECVKENFRVTQNAEITLEINPQPNITQILENAKRAGINRLSIGAQSGADHELKALGRTHSKDDTKNAVATAKALGFSNVSLDLMLGLPDSDNKTLKTNLDFITSLEPTHISAYILKVEPNTLFSKTENMLNLPDEDGICEQYLYMCEYLGKKGFSHYEISNFAKPQFESRHNLKYWNCEEYLGLGPSAHSFLNGERFYYPRDMKAFISGNTPIFDSEGGSDDEKLMLALRLKKGVSTDALPQSKLDFFVKNGFAEIQNNQFSLTDKGMLISNQIILQLLEN